MISLPVANRAPVAKIPRRHMSYSSLSTFQVCPLRYFFRYLEGLPEPAVSSSLALGAAMHSSLQVHYEELLAGNPAPELDILLDVFWGAWKLHEGKKILFKNGEDINTIGRLAERMLRAFQQSSIAHPTGRILAVEEELRGDLIPGLPELLARVDLVVETEHAVEVIDFKTARSPWGADQVANAAGQLLLYGELVRELSDGNPLRLAFAVLTKAKLPLVTVHPVPADPMQITRTRRIVERVHQAIEAGNFYPAPSPLNCPTCPYRQPCREWQG